MCNSDYIRAIRRGNREAELEMFGSQLSMRGPKIHSPKKAYTRKPKHGFHFDEE